jgi:CheY-like chemotaxis protein
MLEILRIFLEDSGCRILVANRGNQAIELARGERPDIITLDLGLPDMDGRDVLRQICGDFREPPPRVIVVTGRQFTPQPSDNVVAVLRKPFDAAELEQAVGDALSASTMARPAEYA